MGFHGGSVVKNPPANAGDMGSIPGSGRCPGEGDGKPVLLNLRLWVMENAIKTSCYKNLDMSRI